MKQTNSEIMAYVRMVLWMVFIMLTLTIASNRIEAYQMKKGVAVSQYLRENFKVVVSAEEARFFNVNVQSMEMSIYDCNLFTK